MKATRKQKKRLRIEEILPGSLPNLQCAIHLLFKNCVTFFVSFILYWGGVVEADSDSGGLGWEEEEDNGSTVGLKR